MADTPDLPHPNTPADPSHSAGLSRRRFMTGVAAAAVSAPLLTPAAASARRPVPAPGSPLSRRVKNLIFMVADGMSFGTLALSNQFCETVHARKSHWMQLIARTGQPRSRASRAMLITRSASGFVTDSSAASCAWGCGVLFKNGAMGHAPDGSAPLPILPHAKQSGRFVGVVTTTRVSHATPAGFCANIPGGRGAEEDIAAQMLERRIDLMLGGGRSRFTESHEQLTARGYHAIAHRDQLLQLLETPSRHKRTLGLFNDSHLNYNIDRQNDPQIQATEPSLAEMTNAAIRIAAASDAGQANGFILQIEGGRVDHAAHGNDAVALVHDMDAFDEALRVALDFAESRDDTLIIVTTDHGNANPGLTEYGSAGDRGFHKLLEGGRHSLDWVFSRVNKDSPLEHTEHILHQATGIELTRDELMTITRWINGTRPHPFSLGNNGRGVLAATLANHTKVAFLSPNHTSDPVELTAYGPGAERIAGTLAMNDVHDVMVELLALPAPQPLESAGNQHATQH